MTIKIYHEAPLALFEGVQLVTDGDYALVHLLERCKEYAKVFQDVASAKKRPLILDNSAYELGEAFDADIFASWVEKLCPTTYVVPDVIGDASNTIEAFRQWQRNYSNRLPSARKMGVIQGNTQDEAYQCYIDLAKAGADVIGVPFLIGKKFVKDATLHDLTFARIDLIKRIVSMSPNHKPIHLLGVALPQEGRHYRQNELSWIDSIDTSNPVMNGMFLKGYDDNGIRTKRKELLADMIHEVPTDGSTKVIFDNIRKFKSLWRQQ